MSGIDDLLKKKTNTEVAVVEDKPKPKAFQFGVANKKASSNLKDKLKGSAKPKFSLGAKPKPETDVVSVDLPGTAATSEAKEIAVVNPKTVAISDAVIDDPGDVHILSPTEEKYTFVEQPDAFAPEVVDQMQAQFEMLRQSLDHPEVVSEAVANILKFMQAHDGLAKLVEPEECGLMVRALRVSYGTTITKKVNNKEKKQKTIAKVDEIVDAMDGMQFEL